MTTHVPEAPSARLDAAAPYPVGPDTFVIPDVMDLPGFGKGFINSLVIRSAEPVIVDTGGPVTRAEWLARAFELVDPADVRWVYLTHDDLDHAGNVHEVLDACPSATLVTTFFMLGRLNAEHARQIPAHRVLFLPDGASFEAGDRTLTAVRPPIYDNPTTRGLFDTKTGVYWSADAFSAGEDIAYDAAEIPDEAFTETSIFFAHLMCPWLPLADPVRYHATVQRIRDLQPSAVACCHGPPLHGTRIEEGLHLMARAADIEPFPEPTMEGFRTMIETTMTGGGLAQPSGAGR